MEPMKIPERHKLTLSMIMKNEANRYLPRLLEAHKQYIDEAVIIDDGSTDNSVALCQDILRGIPLHIVQNTQSKFSNEVQLRKQQWQATLQTNPEWILNLDADEVFENKFASEIHALLRKTPADVLYFRLYDLWDENHYREDKCWHAHFMYRPFLLRYRPGFTAEWNELAQHCGRFPKNIGALSWQRSNLRLKHLGWIDPADREAKYKRYMLLDPTQRLGWKAQYDSILDPDPQLVEWHE